MADSFASGIGLLIGVYVTDVSGEAEKSPDHFITVDFLNGTVVAGSSSALLDAAVRSYQYALESVCRKHGTSVSAFKMLTARYSDGRKGRRVVVEVEDSNGRRAVDEYVGYPLKQRKTVDDLGRVRTLRRPRGSSDG